jgi:hypothetical protein
MTAPFGAVILGSFVVCAPTGGLPSGATVEDVAQLELAAAGWHFGFRPSGVPNFPFL